MGSGYDFSSYSGNELTYFLSFPDGGKGTQACAPANYDHLILIFHNRVERASCLEYWVKKQ